MRYFLFLLLLTPVAAAGPPWSCPRVGLYYAPRPCGIYGVSYPFCPYYLGPFRLFTEDPYVEAVRLLRRGQGFFRYSRLDDALDAFDDSLRQKADFPDAHFWRGLTLQEMDRAGPAASAYRKAILLNYRDVAVTHNNLGTALTDAGDWSGAVAAYREALREQPGFILARDNLDQAEARARLAPRLDAVQQGKAKPADEREAALLAEMALAKDLPSLSARLWEKALKGGKGSDRLYLAVVAALRTDEPMWREQALLWLGEERERREQMLERKAPGDVEDVRQTLRQWQRDPQLEAIRAPAKLIELPPKERRAWSRQWNDVAALLRKADAMPEGRWRVERGDIVQTDEKTPLGQVLYLGEARWDDYSLEAETFVTGDEFGLCVRAADPGTRLLVVFDAAKNRAHRLLVQRDASPLRVLRQTHKEVIEPKRWQRVRVVAHANRIRVVVGERELFDETIQGFSRGKVGLWTRGPSARFRDVRVIDPAGKPLAVSLPEAKPQAVH